MKKNRMVVLLLVTGVSILTACSGPNPTQQAVSQHVETKKVGLSVVKREKAARLSELTGSLQASEEATISFEVAGRVVQLTYKAGDNVRAGETLAGLDSSDYALQVQKAEALVQQNKAGMDEVDNGARQQELAQAKIGLDKAKAGYEKASDDFKRIKVLYQEGAVSQKDYDDAKYRMDTAQQDLQNTQQAYSLTVAGARPEQREQMQSAYNQAVIGKKEAALTLSKTQLLSPINGTIVEKLISVGQLVNPGTPVYHIAALDPLKVMLPVPDSEISLWKTGDSVTLSLYGQTRSGKVTRIDPTTNQGTGTISVEVSVPNPKHDWVPGQVVKSTREINGKEGIFVPVEAVMSSGEAKPYVFLDKEGKARKTPVTIKDMMNNQLEIVSGLKEGDRIVTKGVDRLFDGDPIEEAGGTRP
ncbi:efflux RND transporter periplasmic adaptor subunit [Aneurinibacillus terranovensis]|uniref:efflux RND transporter periplasmic adaptor subunit n=1 Tax=Aneurinibacillus terranovensis TaxID=278991 RepID=UPI0003FAB301|nr:efflux RND transporter periplasmic adaptor subunit [Aneurinibacillus terranovensis]